MTPQTQSVTVDNTNNWYDDEKTHGRGKKQAWTTTTLAGDEISPQILINFLLFKIKFFN